MSILWTAVKLWRPAGNSCEARLIVPRKKVKANAKYCNWKTSCQSVADYSNNDAWPKQWKNEKKIMIVFNVLTQSASVCFSTRLSVTLADCVKTAKHYHNLFSLRIGYTTIGLYAAKKIMIVFSRFNTICKCYRQTGGETDRQTNRLPFRNSVAH